MSSASSASNRTPRFGWRESKRISPANLAEYIQLLEIACQNDPHSADLRTCLGIAQATNYDICKSMESFQAAIGLDSDHFFARFKYGELLFQLGSLAGAEEETRKAVELASRNWESSMARRQLQAIRKRLREGIH
jgi:tetratricopeptide (TPR) repeat protein